MKFYALKNTLAKAVRSVKGNGGKRDMQEESRRRRAKAPRIFL
jgi:hypothetical protein